MTARFPLLDAAFLDDFARSRLENGTPTMASRREALHGHASFAVCLAEHVGGVGAVHAAAADRGREGDLIAVDAERLRGGGAEPLCDRDGVVRLDVLAQHRELVAAEPGGGVAGAQQGGEPVRELDQHGVTGGMAEPVVHRREAVEVEIEQMARSGVAAAVGQVVADPLGEQCAVRQPGQRIVQGLVAELGLALLAFADVLDMDDLVLETACGGGRPRNTDRHPDVAPIHAADAAFVAHDPQLVREHHRAVVSGIVDVVGVDHVVEGATEQRGRIGADQLSHRRIAGEDHTVQPGHGHAHRRVVERAVHGRVQGARREGRHLPSYPRVACGRLRPDPADSDVVTTFANPQLQMHVQVSSSTDIKVWPGL